MRCRGDWEGLIAFKQDLKYDYQPSWEDTKDSLNPILPRPLSPSIRLPHYDYTIPGAYFITICTFERKFLFGNINYKQMKLNPTGKIVESCWQEIKYHFPNIELPVLNVMPNHLHGIIVINEPVVPWHAVANSPGQSESFSKPVKGSIPTIIRSVKSAVTKQVNLSQGGKRLTVWQPGYYEHVIRSEAEFVEISEYIIYNPMKWELDRENPNVPIMIKPLPFET